MRPLVAVLAVGGPTACESRGELGECDHVQNGRADVYRPGFGELGLRVRCRHGVLQNAMNIVPRDRRKFKNHREIRLHWCSAQIADPAQSVLAEGMETRGDVSMVACLASVAA